MSTSLTLDTIQVKANTLSEELRVADPGLHLYYITHHQGQLQNTLHLMEDVILEHPAGLVARQMLHDHLDPQERSGLLGLAVHDTRNWFYRARDPEILAIITINVDQYRGFDDILYDLYHHTWHAIETTEHCHDPEVLNKIVGQPVIPKPGRAGLIRSNLSADIFSALMMATDGHGDAIEKLASMRAGQSVTREVGARPELYPFILVVESARFSLQHTYPRLDKNASRMERAVDITREIALLTTDTQLGVWQKFALAAQDMAWRGQNAREILSLATHAGDDPHIRALAHQVKDILKITPLPAQDIAHIYNPYRSEHDKEQTEHQREGHTALQDALARAIKVGSAAPLLRAANDQNKDLLQGKFLGWAASALQASARAFDRARAQNIDPNQAVRIEYETHLDSVPFAVLQQVGQEFMLRHRLGQSATFDDLIKFLKPIEEASYLIESIEKTIAHKDIPDDIDLSPDPESVLPILKETDLENDRLIDTPIAVPADLVKPKPAPAPETKKSNFQLDE